MNEERKTYHVLWWETTDEHPGVRGTEVMTGPWDTEEEMLAWLFKYRMSMDYGPFKPLWRGELHRITKHEAHDVVSHNRQEAVRKKHFFEGGFTDTEA